jgi:hypothetical protein
VSLEQDIHVLRTQGLSFSQIGARVGLTKDQVQKRYQKYLLSSPLPHTPSPEGDRFYLEGDRSYLEGDRSFSGGPFKKDLTPPTPPDEDYITPVDVVQIDYIERLGERRESTNELVVAAGDFQFPFEDPEVYASFLTFLAHERPDRIVLTGDILDLTAVSAYDKDPRLGMPVQEELAHTHRRLAEIRASAGPEAQIFFLYGNHEARFSKWLAKKAPDLVGLTDADGREILSLANLLRLDALGITPCISEGVAFAGPEHLRSYYQITTDLIATHGTYSRTTGGGASIMPIVEAAGVSVVGGHDHSQGVAFKTIGGFAGLEARRTAAISTGMMCRRTELGYLAQHQVSRWAAGFAVIELWGEEAGQWQPDFASWTGSDLVWRGKRYAPKSVVK